MGASDEQSLEESYKKALACHQSGDLVAAENQYIELLKQFPSHPRLNYLLGCIYIEDGLYRGAIAQFDKSLEQEDDLACRHARLSAFYKNGNFLSLLEASEEVLESHPDDREAALYKARAQLELGELDAAERYYREQLASFPEEPNIHSTLAKIFYKKGNLEWAKAAYASALNFDPKHKEGLLGVGQVLLDMGNLEESERVLRSALESYGDDYRSHLYLAKVFYEQKQYAWAISAAKTTLEMKSDCVEAALLKGEIHDRFNETQFALVAYRHAFYFDKNNPRIHLLLARCCLISGDPHFAEGLLRSIVGIDEYRAEASQLLSGICAYSGRHSAASSWALNGALAL